MIIILSIFKIFNSIFGCGPAVANRLYTSGYRTLEDLRDVYRDEQDSLSKRLHTDFERFKYGLVYYEDLVQNPITLKESFWIVEKLEYLLKEYIDSDCQIELMGGFKRYLLVIKVLFLYSIRMISTEQSQTKIYYSFFFQRSRDGS